MEIARIINSIVAYCLFTQEEAPDGNCPTYAVKVKGVIRDFAFHPDRLKEKKPLIINMIDMMHPNFTVGGGWSFLNLCVDRDGNQWGEHPDCEMLCVLAFAIGRGHFSTPRDFWSAFPGGMPYLDFNPRPPKEDNDASQT